MFDRILEQYLVQLSTAGKSLATQHAVRSDLTQVVERDLRARKAFRQQDEGAAPATINRGLAENPTREVPNIPSTPVSPRSLPDQAVDALLRATRAEPDPRLRLRDEALLALLVYAGVRIQEACDVQLRDLDLASGTLVVRSGKGGKARRLPLHSETQRTLARYLQEVRCPEGLPPIGSEQERAPLLVGMQRAVAGRPLVPGMKTRMARQRIADLGKVAATQLREAAKRERDLARAEQLQAQARQLESASPHLLLHSLARLMLKTGAQLPEVQRMLGHSRLSTTGVYLTPSEEDETTQWNEVLLAHLKRLRGALRGLFTAAIERRPADRSDLEELNRVLAMGYQSLAPGTEGKLTVTYRTTEPAHVAVLLPIALSALHVLTQGEPTRLHRCANERCTGLFYDTTRSATRHWCSTACMNRARSLHHYRAAKARKTLTLPSR